MKQRLIQCTTLSLSVLLLLVSVGVVMWIVRDERLRLAARERAALEAAEQAQKEETARVSVGTTGESRDTEQLLRGIDALLTGLSSDDLPDESRQ